MTPGGVSGDAAHPARSQSGATATTEPQPEFPAVDFASFNPFPSLHSPQKSPFEKHLEGGSEGRAVGERDSAKPLALVAPAFSSHRGTTSAAAKGYYQTNGAGSEAQRRLLRSQVWDPCREEEAAAGTAKVRTLQTSFSKNSHEGPGAGAGSRPRRARRGIMRKAAKKAPFLPLLPTLM